MKFQNIDPRRLESIHPQRIHGKKRKFRGNYFLNKRLKSMPPHSIGSAIASDIDGGDIDGGDIDGGDIDGGDIGSDIGSAIGSDILFYQCI